MRCCQARRTSRPGEAGQPDVVLSPARCLALLPGQGVSVRGSADAEPHERPRSPHGKFIEAAAVAETIALPIGNGERRLVAYPGKRPLIRRLTTRPPQLETPFSVFDEGPITPNDAVPATNVEQVARALIEAPSYRSAVDLLVEMGKGAGVRAHRPAVLRACIHALQLCAGTNGLSFHDAAIRVREQNRLIGRPLPRRAVGSTLLLKGLEG